MVDEIEQEKEKLKEELKEKVKEYKGRAEYLFPVSKFAKAEQSLKLMRVGNGLGMQVPKDLVWAMRLQKGQLLKATFELFPDDERKLFSDNSL